MGTSICTCHGFCPPSLASPRKTTDDALPFSPSTSSLSSSLYHSDVSLRFLTARRGFSLRSPSRQPLSVVAMAPPKPGGKAKKGVEKGSKDPKAQKVGKITIEQLRAIAAEKLQDLNCTTIESAMRVIAGTAANMGKSISISSHSFLSHRRRNNLSEQTFLAASFQVLCLANGGGTCV